MKSPFVKENGFYLFALSIFVVFAGATVYPQVPFPFTDVLRNAVSYAWGYDYAQLYPWAKFQPTYNPYILFDYLLGALSQAVGSTLAIRCLQVSFFATLLLIIRQALHKSKAPQLHSALVAIAVLGGLCTPRLIEARPEWTATLWLLSAFILKPRAWLTVGFVVTPMYWLSPLYSFGAFLLEGSLKSKLKAFFLAGAGSSLFWLVYSKLGWLNALTAVQHLNDLRTSVVPEALPFSHLFKQPDYSVWALGVFALNALRAPEKLKQQVVLLVPVLVFMVIGKTRHLAVVLPLIAVLSLRIAPLMTALDGLGKQVLKCALVLFLAAIMGAALGPQLAAYKQPAPQFELPSGSFVLTGHSRSVFFAPYFNPGKVRIAPSVEEGADSEESNTLVRKLMSGTIQCADLQGVPELTHVLTPDLVSLKLPCLQLVSYKARWTLFKVMRP